MAQLDAGKVSGRLIFFSSEHRQKQKEPLSLAAAPLAMEASLHGVRRWRAPPAAVPRSPVVHHDVMAAATAYDSNAARNSSRMTDRHGRNAITDTYEETNYSTRIIWLVHKQWS